MSSTYHGISPGMAIGKPGAVLGPLDIIEESGSTLLTGLVSWWDLDEESGTRSDAVGSNDLTDNNTVGFTTGKTGNASRSVAGNAETLSLASPLLDQSGGGAKSYSMWYLSENAAATTRLMRDRATYVDVYHTDQPNAKFTLTVRDSTAYREATTGFLGASAPALGWIHVVVTIQDSELKIRVNDSDTFTATQTTFSGEATDNQNFTLHVDDAESHSLDMVGAWNRVLTSDEITELYNLGAGISYPF